MLLEKEVAELTTEIKKLSASLLAHIGEESDGASLPIHIMEHEAVGGGRIIDAAKARATPCKCFTFGNDEYCWSKGVLGLMSSKKNPEQIEEFCAMGKEPASPGARRRFEQLKGVIGEAHEEWEKKKGRDLKTWWKDIGKKLEEKGIEI